MKALILVGGFGTRLRPLTFSMPKPCVEFANLPIVCHQIEALVKAGVTEIVLAINYQPELMLEKLARYEEAYGVKITCSIETEPMGTAGPLALARDILTRDNAEGCFYVLNSDIICNYPFVEMLQFHKSHGKEGTLVVYPVEDPSKYGVVVSNEQSDVLRFVEKPQKYISNKINSGLYLLSNSVLDRISLRPTSIEREIFPRMAEDGQLSSMVLNGFWMDIGQPKDFLTGTELYLSHLRGTAPERLREGSNIVGNVLIDPSAQIAADCLIGPNVTIGPNCVVGSGTRVANSVLFEGTVILTNSWINGSIIGWRCRLGRWVRLERLSVLGEDVKVKDELCLNGTIVLPHKDIGESVLETGKIIL
jgi:mannose-1-phosphate guanylyltransferase